MAALKTRLALSLAAAGVTAAACFFVLRQRDAVRPVEMIDNTAAVRDVLDGRAGEPETTVDAGFPPPLRREPMSDEELRSLYSGIEKATLVGYDPVALVWQVSDYESRHLEFAEHADGGWKIRTNDLGFRKDRDVRATPPDLRILVTGDSHTAGMVSNSESFANVLEDLLAARRPGRSVESLNGGIGGTSLYAYLGVYELWRDRLRPDVVVAAVYGGNDFMGLMKLYRFHHRLGAPRFGPYGGKRMRGMEQRGALAQVVAQAAYFADNPDDEPLAVEGAASILVEMERQCADSGARLIVLYIPPAYDVQPGLVNESVERLATELELERGHLEVSARLSAALLTTLRARAFAVVDLGPIYAGRSEPCYWTADHHINTLGHRLAAEALARELDEDG